MTTGSSPRTRDQALAIMRRLAAGGAITGLTLTGVLAGLMARADVAGEAVPSATTPTVASPQAGALTQMPRRVILVVEEGGGRGAGPAGSAQPAPRGVVQPSNVQHQSRPPAPVVRAPQQPVAPSATSSGSGAR